MLLFGHIGITIGIAWLIESKLRVRVDYKLIAIGSLLPDLVDKPLMLLGLSGRALGHSLIFILLLTALSIKYRETLHLLLASALHLLEDEIWTEPEVLLWPMLPSKQPSSFEEYVAKVISEYDPSSRFFAFEVVGIVILLAFILTKVSNRSQHPS